MKVPHSNHLNISDQYLLADNSFKPCGLCSGRYCPDLPSLMSFKSCTSRATRSMSATSWMRSFLGGAIGACVICVYRCMYVNKLLRFILTIQCKNRMRTRLERIVSAKLKNTKQQHPRNIMYSSAKS